MFWNYQSIKNPFAAQALFMSMIMLLDKCVELSFLWYIYFKAFDVSKLLPMDNFQFNYKQIRVTIFLNLSNNVSQI